MNIPTMTIRAFTNDQQILDKVIYSNVYRIKKLVSETRKAPVVVDLGAHCGYFSMFAVLNGAAKVYSFEPYLENFKVLLENTSWFSDKILPINIGVMPSDGQVFFWHPTLETYYDFENVKAGDSVPKGHINGYQIGYCANPSVIFNMYVEEKEIDLVKINLGYHADIFSQYLGKAKNVCGQCDNPDDMKKIIQIMTDLGFVDSRIAQYDETFIYLFSKTDCSDMFDVEGLKNAEILSSKA